MAEGFDIEQKNINRAIMLMLTNIYSEVKATQMMVLTELGSLKDKESIKRVFDSLESFRELSHKESYETLKNKFGYPSDSDA